MPKYRNSKRIIVSLSISEEEKPILDRFDDLVSLERPRGGRTELMIRAMKEYLDNHWPGNPQQPLFPPSLGDPHRDRAAINFLRHRVKLPLRQIAKIVGRSLGYVQDACGATRFRGKGVTRETLELYKKRFEAWRKGAYPSVKSAFELG